MTSGVPQGSVLGPTLFIIYINDITHLTLSDGSMSIFADNIMIYRPIHTPEDFALLQSDIDKLASWMEQNFLHFAFWHKLAYNFKITSSVFKKKLIELHHNLLWLITKIVIKSHDMPKGVWLHTSTEFTK